MILKKFPLFFQKVKGTFLVTYLEVLKLLLYNNEYCCAKRKTINELLLFKKADDFCTLSFCLSKKMFWTFDFQTKCPETF